MPERAISTKNLQLEGVREKTFQKWDKPNVHPNILYTNGFIAYKSIDDQPISIISCVYCRQVIRKFNGKIIDDDVKQAHIAYKHYCSMNDSEDNISYTNGRLTNITKNDTLHNKLMKYIETKNPTNTRNSNDPPKIKTLKEMEIHPGIAQNLPPVDQLMAANFKYNEYPSDMLTCVNCGGSVYAWEKTDNPQEVHDKFFPSCGKQNIIDLDIDLSVEDFKNSKYCIFVFNDLNKVKETEISAEIYYPFLFNYVIENGSLPYNIFYEVKKYRDSGYDKNYIQKSNYE